MPRNGYNELGFQQAPSQLPQTCWHKPQSEIFRAAGAICHASTGNPIHMEGLSSKDWSPCPRLGAQSQRILQNWLGYTPSDTSFLDAGIIAEAPTD